MAFGATAAFAQNAGAADGSYPTTPMPPALRASPRIPPSCPPASTPERAKPAGVRVGQDAEFLVPGGEHRGPGGSAGVVLALDDRCALASGRCRCLPGRLRGAGGGGRECRLSGQNAKPARRRRERLAPALPDPHPHLPSRCCCHDSHALSSEPFSPPLSDALATHPVRCQARFAHSPRGDSGGGVGAVAGGASGPLSRGTRRGWG